MGKEKPRPQPWADKIKDLQGTDIRFVTRKFEWWCEWASYGLSRWAFLEVLEYIGKLGILIAIVAFFYPGCKERRQAVESARQAAADARISRHYVAWQTLNSASGKPGNAGRADALRDLSQDGVSMDGISLAGHVVLIFCCNLYGATTSSREFIKWAYHQRVVFTNITTLEQWHYCVTNRLDYQVGSPDFIQWASNNFNTYIVTNNPQSWIDWSRNNLKN